MQKIRRAVCCALFAWLCISLQAHAQVSKPALPGPVNTQPIKHRLSFVLLKSGENTFGYDILDQGHLLIHQPNIPGRAGNKGFSSKKDAVKVARLMIKKIDQNIMPPTVTQEELKDLKIRL